VSASTAAGHAVLALERAKENWRRDAGARRLAVPSVGGYPFRLNAYVERFDRRGGVLEPVPPVHDGDTFYVTVDWGKHRWEAGQAIRVLGIACRELDDPGGPEARDRVAGLLTVGSWVGLSTVRDDKYAPRWDCDVEFVRDGQLLDLATELVLEGWAAPWNGRGVQPKPPWPREAA
jgi:endonuclease YncB( thermonuclease family)